jgi:hypothetical protein
MKQTPIVWEWVMFFFSIALLSFAISLLISVIRNGYKKGKEFAGRIAKRKHKKEIDRLLEVEPEDFSNN